jgi:RHS repeat-associated protein
VTGPAFTNSYTYDAASNRTSLTAPDGSISTYGYDTLNRLNGLANSWAGSFGFSYDVLSRRTQLTRPNGVNTNYSYDSLSHLLSVLHQAGVNTLDGASYTYDPAGNRTSKGNYLNGVTSNYSYDPLYELTQVTQGASTTESYNYDAVGNRLSSSGVPSYSYNPSNELTSNSLGSYSYDANGNTLSDPSGKQYSWDFENRLTQAIVPNVGTTTFRYDPFGRRIYKQSPSFTSNFVYDGPNLIQTMNSSGVEVASYTQGVYIDEPLAEFRSGGSSYYQTDALGSITSIGGSSGTPANTYSYDSFGNVTASSGTLPNYFEYTGRDFDPETSLYYYRARYYDPTVGRFLSEDPWNQGPNLYVYVQNDPTNLIDPLGLYSIAPPRPGHPPTPPPSPALDSLLHCIENRLHISLTVTSTTEGSHQDPGHAAGTSVDIRPPSSVSADALFCAAGQCGAQWGINEGQSGSPTPLTTGFNYHIQLRPPNNPHPKSKDAIPPGCTPGGCSGAK